MTYLCTFSDWCNFNLKSSINLHLNIYLSRQFEWLLIICISFFCLPPPLPLHLPFSLPLSLIFHLLLLLFRMLCLYRFCGDVYRDTHIDLPLHLQRTHPWAQYVGSLLAFRLHDNFNAGMLVVFFLRNTRFLMRREPYERTEKKEEKNEIIIACSDKNPSKSMCKSL